MPATVNDILRELDALAPFSSAEEWDNCGLLAGRGDAPVARALLALDLTGAVLREAEALGAQLIVTHHPILFHGRKSLCEDDPEGALLCRLVRSGIALIAAHTCLDRAEGGVADSLAAVFALVRPAAGADGFLRCGDLPAPLSLAALAGLAEERLGDAVRAYGDGGREVRRLAVAPGAGGGFWHDALALGADAFLTGEMRHHEALAAAESGLACLEAGHFATERPALPALCRGLQERADVLQWDTTFTVSQDAPFGA